jgi:hypothetical protein
MRLAKACFSGANRDAAFHKTSVDECPRGSDPPDLEVRQHLTVPCAFLSAGPIEKAASPEGRRLHRYVATAKRNYLTAAKSEAARNSGDMQQC